MISADLAGPDISRQTMGFFAENVAMFTILPQPIFVMCGMYWRINSIGPVRAVSMDSRHISGVAVIATNNHYVNISQDALRIDQ